MSRPRFALALERLQGSDWKRFEDFASAFLTSDYPNLRTVASPSGDEGRDAELFSPAGDTAVVLQYSVSKDWAAKIRKTVRKIKANLPEAKILVYVTNQQIGAVADDLRRSVRVNNKLVLDIVERSYFLERFEGDSHREAVAEQLAKEIVDPFLESRGVFERKGQALTNIEAQAAHLFLALQWEDDTREKGLTNIAFDALVRSVLRNSDSRNRVKRADVHKEICAILHTHSPDEIVRQADLALSRLTKKVIRHWEKDDEFCLTHEERLQLNDRLANIEQSDIQLSVDIAAIVQSLAPLSKPFCPEAVQFISSLVRKVVEVFLLSRGELFASALSTGQMQQLGLEDIREFSRSEIRSREDLPLPAGELIDLTTVAVERVLIQPSETIEGYLRDISDAYTLLAFLRHTPDVQSAARKMFSDGEIWLDTSTLLPWFAEDLLPREKWKFRNMFSIAREAGLKLRVTAGVIEEVERHMNRCFTCARLPPKEWKGQIPFLLTFYIATGRAQYGFGNWLQTFRGEQRPQDDIAEYLREFAGIETGTLDADVSRVDGDLRVAVKEVWTQIHETRRHAAGAELDPILTYRLAQHDMENYIGTIERRTRQGQSAFGYTSWWLTLDHLAFSVKKRVDDRLGRKSPSSPVMSADFLLNYLSFGPVRGKVAKLTDGTLPVALDPALVDYLSPDLLEIARAVREDSRDLPEHVIRRKVRDALDQARRRIGIVTMKGVRVLSEALSNDLG